MALSKASIKTRFMAYVLQMMVVSGLMTLLIIGGILSLIPLGLILPANYYEQTLPTIREQLILNGREILEGEKQLLGMANMGYRLINQQGEVLVENELGQFLPTFHLKETKAEQVLQVSALGNKVIRSLPIIVDNQYEGAIILEYGMRPSSRLPILKQLAPHLNLVILLVPFVVLIIQIMIYAKRFIKTIEAPLKALQQGIEQIQNNNLEFELNCESQDEIGQLCKSFEKMRFALKQSLEASWKEEKLKKDLMSGLSHDLRTPITVINGYTELLLGTSLEDSVETKVLAIHKNTKRLITLVEALNALNKWQQVELIGEKKKIDLENFLRERLEDYKVLKGNRQIKINYLNEVKEQELMLNEQVIIELLDNLISNSLRFTPEGGYITFGVQKKSEHLIFYVEDSGCGFTAQDLKEGFALFYQGDSSRNNGKHYGIGLYIVQYLVTQLGGQVRLGQAKLGGAGVYIEI